MAKEVLDALDNASDWDEVDAILSATRRSSKPSAASCWSTTRRPDVGRLTRSG
jgi:hypothetical protein